MAERQFATAGDGIYRCGGQMGETKLARDGEQLPQCSCPGGSRRPWYRFIGDNSRDDELVEIHLWTSPTISSALIFHADELPERGDRLNFLSDEKATAAFEPGLYEVMHELVAGTIGFEMWVQRIADINPRFSCAEVISV